MIASDSSVQPDTRRSMASGPLVRRRTVARPWTAENVSPNTGWSIQPATARPPSTTPTRVPHPVIPVRNALVPSIGSRYHVRAASAGPVTPFSSPTTRSPGDIDEIPARRSSSIARSASVTGS